MGMSTHVVGIRPPDDLWHKMKAVWDACSTIGVEIPDEVQDYFGGQAPDPKGVVVSLRGTGCVQEYKAEMREGFEVDISKLPKNVKIVRFYNSY